jgi:uncharacterized phage protein gp47/JayE
VGPLFFWEKLMSFGLTDQGLVIKTLSDISDETEQDFKNAFGEAINLSASSALGQIKGVLDERVSLLWELAQGVHLSQYPNTSFGVPLDNVVSINGITRLQATNSTVTGRIFGTLGTAIPTGFVAVVSGNDTAKFQTIETGEVHAGIDEVQTITFSGVPTSGEFKLSYGGNNTNAIQWSDTNTTIETELNGLPGLSEVDVTGDFTAGFTVTFTGADGEKEQALLTTLDNTLSDGGSVTITVNEETKGYLPHDDVAMESINTGSIIANAGSLTVIDTPTTGIDSVTNLLDAVPGRDTETDVDLKLRRLTLLQRSGTATTEGIRNNVLEVDDVIQAVVIENSSNVVDGAGRPPKSFEVFALGGDEQELAQSIFEAKPAGIETVGTISKSVTDSQGLIQTIKFSRPTEIDVYMIINITANSDPVEGALYPADGDLQVENAILAFVQDFIIGQDVVVNQLYTPINEIAGVIGIEILVGTAPSPTLSDNLDIDPTELARFDSTRITVNS